MTALQTREPAPTRKGRRRTLAATATFGLLLAGFVAGWFVSRHVVLVPLDSKPPALSTDRGDAPAAVRSEVLNSLRAFQEGYTRRDASAIGPFMQRLFPQGKDPVVLGTDAGEWNQGSEAIADFIRKDWQGWGDVRIDVDAAAISSAGDVAWLVTTGDVTFGRVPRAMRFTATLVKSNGRWLFRQVQFQWENESGLSLREVLKPSNFSRLRWR
ncbi:MAG TPA: nuclear transport factor 2 family protein [Planctomycetaceae bacterium]|nr:nuclear transport factor 2 family protein [Planctomycetaceae bacterium]